MSEGNGVSNRRQRDEDYSGIHLRMGRKLDGVRVSYIFASMHL